ncbi:speriolin-like [Phascolarctos cinereus]
MPPTSLGRRPRPPGRYHSSTVSPPNPWTMSLLSNYEGLRHQIERLVHENEELKKLVRLIRENRELKSAIKTHASAMGISGINNMFNEEATAHALRTSDRVIPSSAPAQNPGTDDIGILTSLAEILNNSQSSPSNSISTGPHVLESRGRPSNQHAVKLTARLSGCSHCCSSNHFPIWHINRLCK